MSRDLGPGEQRELSLGGGAALLKDRIAVPRGALRKLGTKITCSYPTAANQKGEFATALPAVLHDIF